MPNPTLAQRNVRRAPKLLDRVRETMRTSRYSPRTEAAYVDWIKRYIRFHGIRHPQEMGAEEVKAFLSHLATQMNVAASRCSKNGCLGSTTSSEPADLGKCRLFLPKKKRGWCWPV